MRFVVVIAALAAGVARAEPPVAAVALPAAPATAGQAAEEAAEIDQVDAADAAGIQEALSAGQKELEELQKAEESALPDRPPEPKHQSRLGATNPLRRRVEDSRGRMGAVADPAAPAAQGDVGDVLAELGGLDLGALKAEYDIPVELNDEVLEYIRFFQTSGRKWYAKWLSRSHRWIAYERPILAEEGVPLDLVYLSMIESGFSAYAFSWARASGLWQFISATGRRYGLRDDFWVDERRDPGKATRGAARYLKALHGEFGDWYLAWAGYNAGEGKVRKAIQLYKSHDFWQLARAGRYLRKETKHYVPKLIAAAIVSKHPERFGFTDVEPEAPYDYDEVEIPDATDLEIVAKAAGVTVGAVQDLNPALRRSCTPPARDGKGYVIKLPRGTRDTFLAGYEQVAPAERLTFRHHRVAKGETIGAIAKKYGMPAEAILKLNGVKSAKALRLNLDLIIPLPTQVAQNYPDTGADWREGKAGRRAKHGRTNAPRPAARSERTPAAVASKGRYVVKNGDTLWSISQRFGVAVTDLQRWNALGKRGQKSLQVGRALVVAPPAARGARANAKGRG